MRYLAAGRVPVGAHAAWREGVQVRVMTGTRQLACCIIIAAGLAAAAVLVLAVILPAIPVMLGAAIHWRVW